MSTTRSRGYPYLDLAEACEVSRHLLAELGSGAHGREVFGETLGYRSTHGGLGARKVASLVHFGLLEKLGDGRYRPTPLAEALCVAPPQAERRRLLRQAFERPALHREVLERFELEGRLPHRLAAILHRDFGLREAASEAAAETLRQSAIYAGVLEPDGRFTDRMPAAEGGMEAGSRAQAEAMPSTVPEPVEQRFEIALSGGRLARMSFPQRLSRRDLEIIRKQLEILELQLPEEEG